MPRIQIAVLITHLAGWLIFLSLPVVFITNSGNVTVSEVLLSPAYWLCFFSFVCIFYLHTYLLIPLLHSKQQKFYYFLSAILLVLLILWLRPFDRLFRVNNHQPLNEERQMPPGRFAPHNSPPPAGPPPLQYRNAPGQPHSMPIDIISLFMLIVCMAVGFTLDTSNRLRITAQQAARAEADKANAELSFLKAQINPHFLFNVLNNLYSLALTNSDATADAILKLSNIMRYVTDEVHEDFVSLEREVDCISDFIDLQRLRTGSKVTINYTVQGDISTRKIAPLILTTFIENTFKYGISNHLPCTIEISIKAVESAIAFFCSNQVFEHKQTTRKGTGIANAQKRLEYLYHGKYSLSIDTANNIYTVNLVLQD